MGERKHKAEDGEKEAKVRPGIESSSHVTHPILQLQQLVGNKTVANMIQRMRRSAPGGAVVPVTIQRHLTEEQQSQVSGIADQNQAAANQGAAGVHAAGEGGHGQYEAFMNLVEALGIPTSSAGEESEAPTEGGGE